MNILLGVTGSVAASLTPKMVAALKELGEVRVVFTEHGSTMTWWEARRNTAQAIESITHDNTFTDSKEWDSWQRDNSVLHIDLKNWADILVIAPCSANTLAKMANGMADNLLTCVVRAWPIWKPMFVAPAMNTDMWNKPVTERHLETLTDDYYMLRCVPPQAKVLACGDHGIGAMADIGTIIKTIREALRWKAPIHNFKGLFIPTNPHPGSFGAVRKHDVHTGVDLYTTAHALVSVVEPGIVVDIVDFTGSKVLDPIGKPMSWWNDTKAVLVKGVSGVVVYGEVLPNASLRIGDVVALGETIAEVIPVLPPHKHRTDIPHHSVSMLHIELYTTQAAEKNFRWGTWKVGGPRPDGLLDPTPFLKAMEHNEPK